ncbi:MAG: UvrD-helicase domain-containing protein, partial [Actinomycetota bacterium]|nr:UvrD-helicase domain-containing protein [Actinomycetota bacterium]
MDTPALDRSDLLAGLTPVQVEAVTSEAAPLCILAGAGSGKTRVLTRRIAHRVALHRADPRHVLALTFTRKAANELAGRLQSLGVRDSVVAGTFHAVAYAALRQRWADAGRSAPTLLERKGCVLGRLLTRARLADSLTPAELALEIEWAMARLVPAQHYEREAFRHRRRSPVPASTIATLYREYETEKHRRGLIDFDDLVVQCGE